jgi:hypothetical protein
MTSTAVQRIEQAESVEAVIVRPAISVAEAKQLVTDMKEFRKQVLVPGVDFGLIPGVSKPSLFKPGAEKLLNIFGLGVRHIALAQIEDWDKPFFSYSYRAEVYVLRSGVVISDCEGSCNSYEDKYRYRVVMMWDATDEDKAKAVKVKERKKRKGNGTFKVYYVPNSEPFSLVNTLKKMAQKRAMIGAVLIATRASEEYTQDVEDQEHETPTEEPAEQSPQPTAPAQPPEGATPAAPALVSAPIDDKKRIFAEAKKAGITKETFPAWYTEVTGRAWLDIYVDDIPVLSAAAAALFAKTQNKQNEGTMPAAPSGASA